MRKKTILLAVLVLLSASTAFARGFYPPIPLDHWSYDSLQYLAEEGFLPSAHMGSFDRNEELNRLDMGEYAKLVKSIFDLGQPDSVSIKSWRAAQDHARAFVEEYGVSLKGDVYQDVQLDHWSYLALDYLCTSGALEGYPDGFFEGDRTLTRYEFAQAIVRLLDSMDSQSDDGIVNMLAVLLYEEYSNHLSEIHRMFMEQSQVVSSWPRN